MSTHGAPLLLVSRSAPLFALLVIAIIVFSASDSTIAQARPRWQRLPPTPALPPTQKQGYAPVNGIRMFYAVYGSGQPVILLHGGLANANYWGNQIPALALDHEVVVADSRGHGRSSQNDTTLQL